MRLGHMVIVVIDALIRTIGIVMAAISLLGYVWFFSSLPITFAMPPIIMLILVFVPLKVFARERWLLAVLATAYTASYALGGMNYALVNGQLMTYVLPEALIIIYFILRALSLRGGKQAM